MANEAQNINTPPTGSTPATANTFSDKCRGVFERAKAVIINPAATWTVIKTEPTTVKDIYSNYLVILGALPAIAGFIGLTVVGITLPFVGTTWRAPFFGTLVSQVIFYAVSLGMIYVAALVIEKLGPKFEAKVDTLSAFKLVAYSVTPAWVAGILGVLPWLMLLAGLVGFVYSVYVFWIGVQPMTGVPANRKTGYVVVSALVIFALGIIVNFITANFAPAPGIGTFNGQPMMPSENLQEFEDSMKALQKMLPPR